VGALGILGKGILGSVIDHNHYFCPEFLSKFLRGTMWWCQDSICGISIVGVWGATLIKQPIDSSRGNQEGIWSLMVHRNKIIKFGVCKDLDVEIILVIIFLFQEDFNNSQWVCIPNIKGLHMQKASPLSFNIRAVDPRRLEHMWLLGYLENEMS
jgi:hypothetical protein